MRKLIRNANKRMLPPGFDVDTHFNPSYDPWDQRMCIVPDADLFEAIGGGRVSIVTDRIQTFTETGLALESGREARGGSHRHRDGLKMVPIGAIRLSVDGEHVALDKAVAYRGMQLSGVPNLAFCFGYTNQSWTLGSDLTAQQVCRLLRHMARHGHVACTPRLDPAIAAVPFADLRSGYVLRSIDEFPKQGAEDPWRREQHYARNRRDCGGPPWTIRRSSSRGARARAASAAS
jgi:cation diffusion facilitator CzcD-associated flavoprotein CzcO